MSLWRGGRQGAVGGMQLTTHDRVSSILGTERARHQHLTRTNPLQVSTLPVRVTLQCKIVAHFHYFVGSRRVSIADSVME